MASEKEINAQNSYMMILKNVMKTYHEQMNDYLTNSPEGSLTDADVTIMIMNLVVGVATNLFYSLKQFLPTTPNDYDYIRATVINNLVDGFQKIKEYKPKDRLMPLTVDQIQEIRDKGFTMVKMPDGAERKVNKDDLLFKKDEIDKLITNVKDDATNSKKLIIPNNTIIGKR